MEYTNIQKCIKLTAKKHSDISKDIIDNTLEIYLIDKYGPGVVLLIDLVDRAVNTKMKDLEGMHLSEYKDSLKRMKIFLRGSSVNESISNVNQIPITKLWKWWIPKDAPSELKTIRTLKFWRNENNTTDISIVLDFPEGKLHWGWGDRGTIVLTNTKANNLLRFLIQSGVIFW